MKYWLLSLFFIPSVLFADPRFPFPKNSSEIWQNDLDLRDDINLRISKKGVTDGSDACVGCVGEVISTTSIAAFPISDTVFTDVISTTLSPGDWDVTGIYYQNGTAGSIGLVMAISLYSGNTTTDHVDGINIISAYCASGSSIGNSIPSYRILLTSPTTVYLKAKSTGASNTNRGSKLSARRAR